MMTFKMIRSSLMFFVKRDHKMVDRLILLWCLLIAFTPVSVKAENCNCNDWINKNGYCVAYVKSKISILPRGDAINIPKNKETKDVSEGDAAIFNVGRYGHVAYVKGVNRDSKGNAISIYVSEMNYGKNDTLEEFVKKWNPDPKKAKSEWERAICCGVTSKYGSISERTVPISSIHHIWSPSPNAAERPKPFSSSTTTYSQPTGSTQPMLAPPPKVNPQIQISITSSGPWRNSVSGQQRVTFYFKGSGFSPYASVQFRVKKPDGTEYPPSDFTGKVDGTGNFNYSYPSHCGSMVGTYTVWVIDKPTGKNTNMISEMIMKNPNCK